MPIDYDSAATQKLRARGFKVLAAFSLIIFVVVLVSQPENTLFALLFPLLGLGVSLVGGLAPKYGVAAAKVWLLFATPAAPFLIYLNGLLPAVIVPLAMIFPVMLMNGSWRVIPLIITASCTFVVPLSGLPYDYDIWLRLCVTNGMIALIVYVLVVYLEKALATSLKKTDALAKALRAEQEAKRSQSLFLATMSHEIRTPMNGLLGMLDVMLDKKLDEDQRPSLELVKRSGDALNVILNDILDYSKLSAGKLVIEQIPVNLRHIIEDVKATFSVKLDASKVNMTIKVDANLASMHKCDPTRIAQILNNLVSNAVKYTSEGNVDIAVDVLEQHDAKQTLQFSVSDTGVGIDANQLEAVFEPFRQANDSDSRIYGGTGLGLQIARSLVHRMQGEITVVSQRGVGSTFRFVVTLPICAPTDKLVSAQQHDYRFSGTILVVDDNEINRLVASEMLNAVGVTTVLAEDGAQALEMASTGSFDLILMDLNMPVMDGFEATKQIRQNQPNIPIVALTAAVLEEEVQRAFAAGMNDHLGKPIVRVKLLEVLKKYLRLC